MQYNKIAGRIRAHIKRFSGELSTWICKPARLFVAEVVDGKGVYGIEDFTPNASFVKLYQNYPNPFNPLTTISFFHDHVGHALFIECPIFIANDLLCRCYYISYKNFDICFNAYNFMKYAIITNPISGELTRGKKREKLAEAARIFDAPVYGFETSTKEEFIELSKKVSSDCDVLVVGGGDGTFSDVINSVDLSSSVLAFLPLGSGNALKNALGLTGTIAEISQSIRNGDVHSYDLIDCSSRKLGFMVSIGIEGVVVRLRERYLDAGVKGLQSYVIPTLDAYIRNYKRVSARVFVDSREFSVDDLMSVMVVKQPYFGYKMRVVPNARFDDGRLHVMVINSSFAELIFGAFSSFTVGNMIGDYYTGEKVLVEPDSELYIQIDGNAGWKARSFEFKVRRGILKMLH